MKRIMCLVIVLFCLPAAILAQQDTIHAVKLDAPVTVSDSLHRFELSFDYSIFNRPYADLYDFKPRETIQLETVGPNRRPVFYAKVGAQYPLIPTAELYLQSRNRNGFGIGLYGRHDSFFGSVPNAAGEGDVSVSNMQNTIGGGLTYDWATGEFMLDAKYDFDSFSYKLDGVNPVAKRSDLSVNANFNSANQEDNSLYYDITAGYTYSSFNHQRDLLSSMSESYLQVNGYVGATFEIHRIYVNMNIEFANYAGLKNYSSGVVEFSPIYEYSRKFIKARLGAKFGSSFGHSKEESGELVGDLGAETSIFPDVDARITLIDKSLWIHAIVTGGNDLNPYSKLVQECRMLVPQTEMLAGRRNIDARLSLESIVTGRLGINLLGSYTMHTKKLIYCPVMEDEGPKRIKAGYLDLYDFSFGAEVFWKSNEVTLGGSFKYDRLTERGTKRRITEIPSFYGNAFLRYNFRERLIASLDFSYSSKVSGSCFGDYSVPSIIDVNVNVNYRISRNFSVFAKCGNILDQRNQYMPLYVEPGRNYGGGICVNF